MGKFFRFLALLLLFLICSDANEAKALPSGWSVDYYRGMKLVKDIDRNYEWLSPVYSKNISFNEISLKVNDVGSIYYGFRFASMEDLTNLGLIYGADFVSKNYLNFTKNNLYQLFDDFGTTYNYNFVMLSGIVNTVPDLSRFHQTTFMPEFTHIDGKYYLSFQSALNMSSSMSYSGSWLIRDITPVPEPSTFVMTGLGLLCSIFLVSFRRIKKIYV